MQRSMRGFHRDAEGHWVAELSCGHAQHVRHQPPFTQRPWVMTPEGRASRIGQSLDCPACDRREMPPGHAPYRRTKTFTAQTVPRGLLDWHDTKAGVWGRLHVERGSLDFFELEGAGELRRSLQAGQHVVLCPEVRHRVALSSAVEFFVEFWRAAIG